MANSSRSASPFSWPPSQSWNGNAGAWSSFWLRAGTPPQDFEVLPASDGNQIWIPVPEGCADTNSSDCGGLRGVSPFQGKPSNGFQKNESSTWQAKGIFTLDIEDGLNFTGNGDFGFDTVGLGIQNSDGLTLDNQLVAGIATTDFYIGEFGLGEKPSNLSSYDNPIPSYMRSLRDNGSIPSLSYGYTAGAQYQLEGVFGSLTLGGYDESRLIPSNLSIPFDANDSRRLTLGLQSLVVSNTSNGSITPIQQGEYFLIDSSITDLWLPLSACQDLEEALGLTYDNSTDLYTVNSTSHDSLLKLNPSFIFNFGAATSGGQSLAITLPYAAFDLQAKAPFYQNATNYFPIRRAANETQYVLGRTLLQEAYIIVDYERQNFSVAPATYVEGKPVNLVAINTVNTTQPAHGVIHQHKTLSHGAIAGIIVAGVLVLALLIGLGFWKCFPREAQRKQEDGPRTGPQHEMDAVDEGFLKTKDDAWPQEPNELGGQAITDVELGAGDHHVAELDADPVILEISSDHVRDSFRTQDDTHGTVSPASSRTRMERQNASDSEQSPGPFIPLHNRISGHEKG